MSGIIAQNSGRHTGLVKASSAGGVWNLIETLTSDGSDSDLSFTSGIDSTYDEYVFKFINIHPETDDKDFTFQGSTDGGSNYNTTITSTYFSATHSEDDSTTGLSYKGSIGSGYPDWHLEQETSFQTLADRVGSGNDECTSGTLHLFSPSDTTFVKHFIGVASNYYAYDFAFNSFAAGYFNSASAIDAIQFKFNSGEIQGGSVSLYGIS
jgi:hypothetical protein